MDEIAKQAHQGSVAAIVQIMNDCLADMGVRTRAVLEKGILQVLCEAKDREQLEQSVLTARLREILEGIAPKNLRRVNICSRIAIEQQLVWLDDIHRNPENEILWSQEILLKKPNLLQKWFSPPRNRSAIGNSSATSSLSSTGSVAHSSSRLRNILGMVGLCGVSFLAGLAYNNWQEQNFQGSRWRELFPFLNSDLSSVAPAAPIVRPESPASPAAAPASPVQSESSPEVAAPTTVILPTPNLSNPPPTPQDPFAEAVQLAEAIALKGQIAQTEAEWLDLSDRWQQAAQLMAAVPQNDPRYSTARDRVEFYQKNSEVARARAKEQQ